MALSYSTSTIRAGYINPSKNPQKVPYVTIKRKDKESE